MATPRTTTTRRAPQDHRVKATESGPEVPFEFKHKGKTYELEAARDVLTAGFARKNRHKSQAEQLFDIIEALAGPEALDAIDSMSSEEFRKWQEDFYAHNGVELGE